MMDNDHKTHRRVGKKGTPRARRVKRDEIRSSSDSSRSSNETPTTTKQLSTQTRQPSSSFKTIIVIILIVIAIHVGVLYINLPQEASGSEGGQRLVPKPEWETILKQASSSHQLMQAMKEFIRDVTHDWQSNRLPPSRPGAATLLVEADTASGTEIARVIQNIIYSVFDENQQATISILDMHEYGSSVPTFLQAVNSKLLRGTRVLVIKNIECCIDVFMSLKSHVDKDTMEVSHSGKSEDVIHMSARNHGFLLLSASVPVESCCHVDLDSHLQVTLGWRTNMVGRIGNKVCICSQPC